MVVPLQIIGRCSGLMKGLASSIAILISSDYKILSTNEKQCYIMLAVMFNQETTISIKFYLPLGCSLLHLIKLGKKKKNNNKCNWQPKKPIG